MPTRTGRGLWRRPSAESFIAICAATRRGKAVISELKVASEYSAVLEPTKEAVLRAKAKLDSGGVINQAGPLTAASKQSFYNASRFLLKDLASGTGGMLTVSQGRLLTLAKSKGKQVSINLYGQEINPETYAINQADILLKGDNPENSHSRNLAILNGLPQRHLNYPKIRQNRPGCVAKPLSAIF